MSSLSSRISAVRRPENKSTAGIDVLSAVCDCARTAGTGGILFAHDLPDQEIMVVGITEIAATSTCSLNVPCPCEPSLKAHRDHAQVVRLTGRMLVGIYRASEQPSKNGQHAGAYLVIRCTAEAAQAITLKNLLEVRHQSHPLARHEQRHA